MEKDRFDIIVIKSQDRLNRNTRDWYIFADHLNKCGKRLFLYMENKFYVPSEDALITGIKAILAEEYSRDLSKKLNNSNQRRIEKAKKGEQISAMGNGQTYGYRIVNKQWVVDPEEAAVVERVCIKSTLNGIVAVKWVEGIWGVSIQLQYLKSSLISTL